MVSLLFIYFCFLTDILSFEMIYGCGRVGIYEVAAHGKHPTNLIRSSCLHLMRIIAVSVGLNSDVMRMPAMRSFTNLLREIVYVSFVELGVIPSLMFSSSAC